MYLPLGLILAGSNLKVKLKVSGRFRLLIFRVFFRTIVKDKFCLNEQYVQFCLYKNRNPRVERVVIHVR